MFACDDIDMNCLYFNVKRLLDFVDVFRMKRTNRRTQVPIGLYPCHIEEKMTIKEVREESVMEWKTKVTTKEGIVIKFPGKFRGYKLATKEEVEENEGLKEVWEQMKNNGCSYKTFTACNPKEFDGKGGAVALTRWIEKMESVFDNSGCTANQRVRYAASCFVNKALTWWNTQVQERGREAAIGMGWNDFRALLVEEFCPSNKMEKLENEFWNHTMVGANHVAYSDRFHELAKLVPHLVTSESSRIKRYINGLAPQIRGMLRATQPTTIQSTILTAEILTDEAVRYGTLTKGNDKRKEMEESSKQGSTWKDNNKFKNGSGFVATVPPRNDNVNIYPKQVAHVNAVRMGQNQRACYECGSLDHLRYDCPKWKQATRQARNPLALEGNRNTRNNGNQARGREFNGNAVEALQDPKVMTELHQLDTFYNALNPNDQDALDSAAGEIFLDKIPCECLSIIESKSKVRYSRSRVTDVRENANAPLPSSSHSNSFDLQQIAASLEDKLDIRMNRFEKSLNDIKNSFITPTSPLKSVEEICVTCGANHSYNQCPLTRGNDFLVFHDNIQQFQTAAVGNFIQNRNQNVSNQMRPPGF
nr:reverse transcriptase domain-containing protein [Tanacetum cinerariifolium]